MARPRSGLVTRRSHPLESRAPAPPPLLVLARLIRLAAIAAAFYGAAWLADRSVGPGAGEPWFLRWLRTVSAQPGRSLLATALLVYAFGRFGPKKLDFHAGEG